MDNSLEFIHTVGTALLLINIDILLQFLFDSLNLLVNILWHLSPSDIKWHFIRAVIVIVVVLILWEIREIYRNHSH